MEIRSTRIQNSLIRFVLVLLISSISLVGCSRSADDEAAINPDITVLSKDTALNVNIVDAAGNPVDAAEVVVTTDASDIIPADQETQNSNGGLGGIVGYNLNGFTDTQQLQIRASKAGYVSNNMSVDVIEGQANIQTIRIIKLGDKLPGINSASKIGDISIGAITVNASGVDEGNTTVTIAQNSSATTVDGTPLSNMLTVNVVQLDHDTDDALDAFPGGFAVSLENPDALTTAGVAALDNEPVTDDEVTLQTSGFTIIEVKDDQGNIAKNFTTPIKVQTKIKDTIINPETDLPFQIGDTLPLWSFDNATGKWSYEQIGTILSDGIGGLMVDYEISHLSCWNHGHYRAKRCKATLTFNDSNPEPQPLIGRLFGRGWSRTFQTDGNSSVIIRRAPARFDVKMRLKTFDGTPVAVSPTKFNLCDPNSHTFNIDTPVISKFDLSVSVATYCSNDNNASDVAVPEAYVWAYSPENHRFVYGKTNSDGTINFRLPAGTYKVWIYSPLPTPTFHTEVVTISETEPGIVEPQTCDIPTGATGATGATGSTGATGATGG